MWTVGNGQTISIREDKWLKSGIIGGLATRNEPEKVGALIDQRERTWNEEMLQELFDEQRIKEILATPIGLLTTADKMVWMSTKSGAYSVKSGYIYNRSQNTTLASTTSSSCHQTQPKFWKFLWKSNTIPRVKQFLWNACQNAIPTVENLHRRRIVPDPLCPVCKKEAETIEHTLLLCPWTVKLWRETPLHIQISRLGLMYGYNRKKQTHKVNTIST